MKLMKSLFATCALVLGAAIVTPAAAQPVESIAVVDLSAIMRDSLAAKSLQAQMKKHMDDFRASFKKQEESFRTETEKLVKQRNVLSAEDFKKRQLALRKKIADAEIKFRKREQKIRQAGAQAQQELNQALQGVVAEAAKGENVSLVVPKNMLLYSSGNTKDLTQKTLAALDKKLPKLTVAVK